MFPVGNLQLSVGKFQLSGPPGFLHRDAADYCNDKWQLDEILRLLLLIYHGFMCCFGARVTSQKW